MPLVRVKLKSEFGLGNPHLYNDANIEDPKAVLDGVAVAGLVGILRQLGDLAEYVSSFFLLDSFWMFLFVYCRYFLCLARLMGLWGSCKLV